MKGMNSSGTVSNLCDFDLCLISARNLQRTLLRYSKTTKQRPTMSQQSAQTLSLVRVSVSKVGGLVLNDFDTF